MHCVGIIGKNGQDMVQEFMRLNGENASCVCLTGEEQCPELDVLVVSEGSAAVKSVIPRLAKSGYLVVNADDKTIFPYIAPAKTKVITYGFSGKACITASSVSDDSIHICIQRGFTDLNGMAKDPQEFMAASRGAEPETTLGAAAAWVICG